MHRAKQKKAEPARSGGFWGPVLVSLCACVLTVSIVGSAVFLAWRAYSHHQLKKDLEIIIASLENRTAEELEDRVALLKARPKLAAYVLPEVARSMVSSRSERQQWAAIQISRAFLDNEQIQKALLKLRHDAREGIAAAAVEALGELEPPERAVEVMGQCLVEGQAAAADEACAALYRLGDAGLAEMQERLPELSIGRRIWLVRYTVAVESPHQRAWLEMLSADKEERVRTAADEALGHLASSPEASIDHRESSLAAVPG